MMGNVLFESMGVPARIEKIVPQADAVSVHLSGLDSPLLIPRTEAVKHQLKPGIVLTDAQIKVLRTSSELLGCDRELARLLTLRGHSEAEVRSKLKRKQFGQEAINTVVRKYRQRGLLDDGRLALELARKKIETAPCGKGMLVAWLQKKMIDRQLAERTVAAVMCDHSEDELAIAALRRRWRQLSQFELETARTKAYNYLSRRGFGYGASKNAFEQLTMHDQEDSDH